MQSPLQKLDQWLVLKYPKLWDIFYDLKQVVSLEMVWLTFMAIALILDSAQVAGIFLLITIITAFFNRGE